MSRDVWAIDRVRTHDGVEEGSTFFWKNIDPGCSSVPTPFTHRFRVTGRPASCGSSHTDTAA